MALSPSELALLEQLKDALVGIDEGARSLSIEFRSVIFQLERMNEILEKMNQSVSFIR